MAGSWMVMAAAMITKEMTIGEVLRINRETARILMAAGMHCLGCPHSQGESLEEACAVHGVDVNDLVKQLNDFLG